MVAVQAYKKRKFKTSSVLNIIYKIENNKLNITNTNDMKDRSETWFQNKSVNKSDLDIKKNRDSDEDKNKEN